MPERSSNQKSKKKDINETAFSIMQRATGQAEKQDAPQGEKNAAAVVMGRLGGLKGGKARAKKLNAEERTRIAQKAARARWKKNQSKS